MIPEKCPHCPVPVGQWCPRQVKGVARYCALADPSGPEYRPGTVAGMLAAASGYGPDAEAARAAIAAAEGVAVPGVPPIFSAEALAAVEACEHRGQVVDSGEGCGCGPTVVCLRDTRVVGRLDCLACLGLLSAPGPG